MKSILGSHEQQWRILRGFNEDRGLRFGLIDDGGLRCDFGEDGRLRRDLTFDGGLRCGYTKNEVLDTTNPPCLLLTHLKSEVQMEKWRVGPKGEVDR
jgi:hypothetical protein